MSTESYHNSRILLMKQDTQFKHYSYCFGTIRRPVAFIITILSWNSNKTKNLQNPSVQCLFQKSYFLHGIDSPQKH